MIKSKILTVPIVKKVFETTHHGFDEKFGFVDRPRYIIDEVKFQKECVSICKVLPTKSCQL